MSNFSFLQGASHPEELVRQAQALGYRALALADECSLAGVVRAHVAAKKHDFHLIVGSRFIFDDDFSLLILARSRAGYAQLSALISRGRRAAVKGEYQLSLDDLFATVRDECILIVPARQAVTVAQLSRLIAGYPGDVYLGIQQLRREPDVSVLQHVDRLLADLPAEQEVPVVALGGALMHVAQRQPLQDVLTAIRLNTTVAALGHAAQSNAECYLRPETEIRRRYLPAWCEQTLEISARCHFSLDELRYEYPAELVPAGISARTHLQQQVLAGMQRRWPDGAPAKVVQLIEHELALIAELGYEHFFLTVYDLVRFAREQNILCQGRGSAANSAVCFCLGITEVDPARMEMLFERFISKERDEPPDIDVDFEHERREEVIQYIYRKYTRERAALAATVITYRHRSALRDTGRVMGLEPSQIDRLTQSVQWWDGRQLDEARLREAGFDPENACLRQVLMLAQAIYGFPRHLSQHVGGFVISRGPLSELVPVENATMPERTVIQWDKDDLEALGLLKVDVLALGMLSAIRRCFDLMGHFYGRRMTMADIPAEDPSVYAMMSRADTIGVFQIESRAQMAMLPRLQPRTFYDLVIEVSLVRPGPIQGNMVHPYLRRRQGLEPVSYPSREVESVLQRTLGVPIFQEQVIKLAMVAAGFSAGEADQLRRAMAAWKRKGGLEPFEKRLIEGMRRRGYDEGFARQVFEQIKGFGEYGFPESHAASFSLLVYVSAWLKYYQPAVFCCALINSQPMGFYSPAQLVRDAREHGVEVRPVDVLHSDWDCTLEPATDKLATPCLRLGLRLVRNLAHGAGEQIMQARTDRHFQSLEDMVERTGLNRRDLEALAAADALQGLAGNRHQVRWAVAGVEADNPMLGRESPPEQMVLLPEPDEVKNMVEDFASVGLSLGRHPLALVRERYPHWRVRTAKQLAQTAHGRFVRMAGLVTGRQRPMSASGVTFLTLEDETGMVNVVVWQSLAQRQRKEVLHARLLEVSGVLEREGQVMHLIAGHLRDRSDWLGMLEVRSRDFH